MARKNRAPVFKIGGFALAEWDGNLYKVKIKSADNGLFTITYLFWKEDCIEKAVPAHRLFKGSRSSYANALRLVKQWEHSGVRPQPDPKLLAKMGRATAREKASNSAAVKGQVAKPKEVKNSAAVKGQVAKPKEVKNSAAVKGQVAKPKEVKNSAAVKGQVAKPKEVKNSAAVKGQVAKPKEVKNSAAVKGQVAKPKEVKNSAAVKGQVAKPKEVKADTESGGESGGDDGGEDRVIEKLSILSEQESEQKQLKYKNILTPGFSKFDFNAMMKEHAQDSTFEYDDDQHRKQILMLHEEEREKERQIYGDGGQELNEELFKTPSVAKPYPPRTFAPMPWEE